MRMVLRRLLSAIPIVLLITVLAFLMVELIPGSAAHVLAGDDASPENVRRIEAELGLDKPAVQRYLQWMGGMARGDFGRSLASGEPVGTLLLQRLPTTASLTVVAVLLALLLGVPLGVMAGITPHAGVDRAITLLSTAAVAVPNYVVALLLALLFSLTLRWFPSTGYADLGEGVLPWLRHLLLPSLALSLVPAAVVARQLRSSLREVMRSDYIRTARAKGLREPQVVLHHALRNACGPALTALGAQVALLLSGAVAVEMIFALPGLGQLAINAVGVRDVTVVQGVVVVGALAVVVVNLGVDLACQALYPGMQLESA